MSAVKLIIADENMNYTKCLAQYLQEDCGQAFDVICFTQRSFLTEYLFKNESVDILLINPQLYNEEINEKHCKSVILLVDSVDNTNKKSIYKYQKADQIKRLLLQEYDKNSDQRINILNSSNKCKLICVYSASGAAGKTTMAYNLALQYSMKAKKVLYISLETYSSLDIFNENEASKGLIYILYLIKNKLPNIQMKLNTMIANDHNTNINYIEREINVLEYKDIRVEDFELLSDFIRNQTEYEAVILDLDSSLNEVVLGAFKFSDVIVNVYSDDKVSSAKQERFGRQINKISSLLEQDINSKLLCVKNKSETVPNSEFAGEVLEIPFIHGIGLSPGTYFPEMIYFNKVYDVIENSC